MMLLVGLYLNLKIKGHLSLSRAKAIKLGQIVCMNHEVPLSNRTRSKTLFYNWATKNLQNPK